jgi:YD repeat-containing protein
MTRSTSNGPYTQTRTFVYASTTYSTLVLPALWLTMATNPENGTVSYTYNADGTLASKEDANGNTETYTYDAYQRLTGIPDRRHPQVSMKSADERIRCVCMPGRASFSR